MAIGVGADDTNATEDHLGGDVVVMGGTCGLRHNWSCNKIRRN